MRIAILSQSYFPIHGGVAEHVHHQAEELRKRGHDVTIITAFFNRGDENYSEHVIRIGHDMTIPMNGAFVNCTIGRNLGGQLKRIEQKHTFDLVHIHGPLEPFLPFAALRVFQCPKVGTFHSYSEKNLAYSIFKGIINRRYAAKLDARIAVSEAAKKFFSQYFPGDYHIIPNGVDTERFRPDLPHIQKYDDGVQTILFVGRMDPRKGLKYLLQAFPAVVKACPNTRLVVVGGGMMAGYYKGFINDTIADRVHFEGYVSAEKLPRYYATADVYCSPATDSESFGIVLIESMAAGTPVVAYDNFGYKLVMEREPHGGLLVENRSVPKLAEALIKLLTDGALHKQCAQEAREKAQHFAWPHVVGEIEQVYEQVLNQRKT